MIKATVTTLTQMGFVSLASSQSQYFSVIVFFFFCFSPCVLNHAELVAKGVRLLETLEKQKQPIQKN